MFDPSSFKGLDIFFWKTCFCWRAVGEGQYILISKGEFKCVEVTKKLFVKTFYGWADRWTLLIESNRTQYHKEFALEGRGKFILDCWSLLYVNSFWKKTLCDRFIRECRDFCCNNKPSTTANSNTGVEKKPQSIVDKD